MASQITLSNDLAELGRANMWLAEWADAGGMPPNLVFALRLCLEEAFANVVMHGQGTKDDEVQVGLARDEAAAILTLVDGGRPFDPLQAAAPTLATDLEQAEIGGNGLTLIRRFADHVAYRREQDRNHLELRFQLSRDSAAPDR